MQKGRFPRAPLALGRLVDGVKGKEESKPPSLCRLLWITFLAEQESNKKRKYRIWQIYIVLFSWHQESNEKRFINIFCLHKIVCLSWGVGDVAPYNYRDVVCKKTYIFRLSLSHSACRSVTAPSSDGAKNLNSFENYRDFVCKIIVYFFGPSRTSVPTTIEILFANFK